MKKFLLLGALVAGLALVGTARTAEAGHDYGRSSCRSRGYSYGSYYPSYSDHSYSSPGWSHYRHGRSYRPSRHHRGHRGYDSYRGHRSHRRSGFGLYIGNGDFGISIRR